MIESNDWTIAGLEPVQVEAYPVVIGLLGLSNWKKAMGRTHLKDGLVME